MIAFFAAFFAGPVSGSFLIALAVFSVLLVAMIPVFNVLGKRTLAKREEEFADLAAMINGHLRVPPPAAQQEAPPQAVLRPEIDLDVDPLPDSQSAGISRRNRTS